MKKIDVISTALSIILLGLSLSSSVAQTTKEMLRIVTEDLSHNDDAYYCFTHSSEKQNVEAAFTDESIILIGVLKVSPPDGYAGEGSDQAFFYFFTGNWIDDTSASLDMYMLGPDQDIIEESKQEVLFKKINDFEIALTEGDRKEIILDLVSCEEIE